MAIRVSILFCLAKQVVLDLDTLEVGLAFDPIINEQAHPHHNHSQSHNIFCLSPMHKSVHHLTKSMQYIHYVESLITTLTGVRQSISTDISKYGKHLLVVVVKP